MAARSKKTAKKSAESKSLEAQLWEAADQMRGKAFPSVEQAQRELEYNGFELFDKSHGGREFISVPAAPFSRDSHPNGKIYSSGRFWKMPK